MKNKHTIHRIIGAIIAVLGVGLCCLAYFVLGAANDLTLPLIITGVVILGVGILWYLIATDNSRKYCDACGESLLGCAYQYQSISSNATVSKEVGGEKIRHHYKINIITTCPHCGAMKEFKKNFTIDAGQNIEYFIDDYCRKTFGH